MTKKKGKAKAGAAAEGSAAPVRAKAHQSRLEASFEKKLKAPRDDINHVIGVPYDHWNYANSAAGKAEEARAKETGTFKCKVVDFELSKRFPAIAGKAVFISDAFKLQLVLNEGSEDAAETFYLQYPLSYLRFRNSAESKELDPELHAETEAAAAPAPKATAGDGDDDSDDEPASERKKGAVWAHVKLLSEGTHTDEKQKNFGKPYKRVARTIICDDGKECGHEFTFTSGSNGVFTKHLGRMKDDQGHVDARKEMIGTSSHTKEVLDDDGNIIAKKWTFDESFDSYVQLCYMVVEDFEKMHKARKKGFRTYVKSLNPRATPPPASTTKKIPKATASLQMKYQSKRIADKKKKFRGDGCIAIQLDMWSDNEGESFGCINMTSVIWKEGVMTIVSEVLEFGVFPYMAHTAENIKKWVEGVLEKKGISFRMVVLVAPDGAGDGQAAFKLIGELRDKTIVCFVHNLQRGVLYGAGLAGPSGGENPEVKALVKRHARTVQLHSQAKIVRKAVKQGQLNLRIPRHLTKKPIKKGLTRWGGIKKQVTRNIILQPFIDDGVAAFTTRNGGEAVKMWTQSEQVENDDDDDVSGDLAVEAFGFTPTQWVESCHLEAALELPMLMSDMGQGVGRGVTSDQVIIMAANVIKKQSKPLEVKGLRGRTKSEKRERTVVEQSRLTAGAQKFRKILAREMKARHFGKKFPNALLILLALSKQTKNVLKTVFGDDEEKKDEAKAALIAAYRARKPRAAPSSRSPKKKKPKSPKKKRSAELVGDSDDDDSDDDDDGSADDEETNEEELERWSTLRSELVDEHTHNYFVDHLALASQQKVGCPIICDLYEANAPALVHEGNTEREFSSAKQFQGHLCRMAPETLCLLMFVRGGLSAYKPTTNEINAEYDLLYGKKPSTSASEESGGASSTDVCPVAETLEEVDSSSDDAISDDESDSDDDDVDSS